jgi:serine/threonine protein kinase/tetratricopeptide (TPR) repeat protein
MSDLIGRTLGHYRVVEKIGEGGMGEVYRAHDERLDRDVAIKVLPEEVAEKPDRLARFEREAKALAALNHPNIATVHGLDNYPVSEAAVGAGFTPARDDDRAGVKPAPTKTFPLLIMELLEGETLRERLGGAALGWRKATEVGAAIADGLGAAHEAGIYHRDLKPSNVFLTADGRVKVVDFGLARLEDAAPGKDVTHAPTITRQTDPGTVLGTVGYMSPEQVRGETVDQRSDIFSLGCVLYEMASGQRAFTGDSAVETMNAILKEEPSDVSSSGVELPPELAGTIRRCLEKRPQARFQSASDLAYNLRTISSASVQTVAQTEPDVSGRKRLTLALAAAAAIVAAAFVIALYFGRGGDEPVGIGASGRPAVAVMPFDCTAASEDMRWLRQGVPDMLVTGLAQTQGLDVVSSERLLEILNRLAPESAEAIAPRQVLEVARRAGAGAVVMGSVIGTGPELRIDVRVQDPADGRLLFAHGVRGDEVFALVDEISEQIRADLGLATAAADRGMAELTSESLEAYRLYTEGRNAWRNFRRSDALELFRRAVEIDPSFTMAYFELWRFSQDRALRQEYRKRTMDGLDRLSERERLKVESWAAAREGDDKRALMLQEELVTRYPDEAEAYYRLFELYSRIPDTEKAMQTLERGVRAVPTDGQLRSALGYELVWSGRFDEGLREFEAYARILPEEPNPHDSFGDAYRFMGKPEEAIARYTDALGMDDTFSASYKGRAWAYAVLGRYDDALRDVAAAGDNAARIDPDNYYTSLLIHSLLLTRMGRYQEAERIALEVKRSAATANAPYWHAWAWQVSSLTALDRSDFSKTIDYATRVLEALEGQRAGVLPSGARLSFGPHLAVGIAEARSGRFAAAEEHLDAAGALFDSWSRFEPWIYRSVVWLYRSLEGEIALASGDLARAEAAFAAGLSNGRIWFGGKWINEFFEHNSPSRDWRARIHKARGDATGAITEYRRLLAPSADHIFIGVLEPRYVLELARLLDQAGDHEAALDEYKRFLELWKNADPDLPELAEARTRLAQLETTPP